MKALPSGMNANYCVSANVAAQIDQQAEYLEMRGLDEQHYQELILQYLRKFKQAKRIDFEKLLIDKLPQMLDEDQRKHRVRNLLQKMRKEGLLEAKGLTWHLKKS